MPLSGDAPRVAAARRRGGRGAATQSNASNTIPPLLLLRSRGIGRFVRANRSALLIFMKFNNIRSSPYYLFQTDDSAGRGGEEGGFAGYWPPRAEGWLERAGARWSGAGAWPIRTAKAHLHSQCRTDRSLSAWRGPATLALLAHLSAWVGPPGRKCQPAPLSRPAIIQIGNRSRSRPSTTALASYSESCRGF